MKSRVFDYLIIHSFGEPLTYWSFLQLGGFLILSVGILMFNGTIKVCRDEETQEAKEAQEKILV